MKNKLVINKKILFGMLILFFLIPSAYLSRQVNIFVRYFFMLGRFSIYLYVFIIWLKKRRLTPTLILFACMVSIIILSTWLNDGDIIGAIAYRVDDLVIIMWMDAEIDDFDSFWNACILYLAIMIVINFITILAFPTGMYDSYVNYNAELITGQTTWFYANKNGLGKSILYLLFFCAERDLNIYGKLTKLFYFFSVVSIISLIAIWSAASLVTTIVMIAIILFAKMIHKYRFKLFNLKLFFAIIAGLFIFIIILQRVDVFASFITVVLKKSLTFNGRAPIWINAIMRIGKKPLLGYGHLSGAEFISLIGRAPATDAHNYFLTLVINGGFIALLFFLIILLMVIYSIKKYQYEYSGITLSAFLFSFFILMLFENTSTILYWVILDYAITRGGISNLRNK